MRPLSAPNGKGNRALDELRWNGGMFRASVLLTAGSLMLFIGISIVLAGYFLFAFPLFGGIGLPLHLLAWILLYRLSTRMFALQLAFLASVLGFAVGLATLPFVPVAPGPGSYVYGPTVFLVAGGFAYAPSVFGPVATAHAGLFMLALRWIRSPLATLLLVCGATVLVLTSILGIMAQFSLIAMPWPVPLMAGITALGYGPVGAAWRLERGPFEPHPDRGG